ncbi:hypothetical protein Rhe02_26720 [Rhizocola hellebori]|uniref:DUF402 domain-containing protein n=1 Tax=Rhizocola hellebori TaxID=1392758 RepID=A0A8J3Q695_9ACTN|nr:DUF402 domain-containing protein [Rhizocola hellebori]GIH04605.1 hypothetical protein Rhe02_26720 [Rhizocola hellebori]
MRRFQPGETVIRREIMHGEVWFAYPSICVQDEGDLLVTYLPTNTEFGFPTKGRFPIGEHPWRAEKHTHWSGHGMLALHWEGVDHAVFVYWNGPQREHAFWYFNLQDAPRRTPIGFDTLDHELDLLWRVGAPTWEWKDVEEFAKTGEARYPGRVHEIQAEGDRVAKLLDAGERWWDESWASWQPDPQWAAPTLPAHWEEVPCVGR